MYILLFNPRVTADAGKHVIFGIPVNDVVLIHLSCSRLDPYRCLALFELAFHLSHVSGRLVNYPESA